MARSTIDKLTILADAAKYDASCASSGTSKRDSKNSKGIGSTEGMGICHSYAPDGRCISLLKVLLTNFCIFDCRYCVNRSSSNVERARFKPEELAALTLDFYKRNYIEGLFLSSGIIQSANYTMEQMVEVARILREDHHFAGYIHLKTIAEADPELIALAGQYADRLSVNIELPSDQGLKTFAPEKSGQTIRKAMADVKYRIDDRKEAQKSRLIKKAAAPKFAPGGQSTQMIVGADGAKDQDILSTANTLYSGYGLRRVYYSAYSPIPDASSDLPPQKPPLMREHRLYQADWMVRFYGFETSDVLSATTGGMFDLDVDPKLAWSLRHRDWFPMDINRATREQLLRVPGLGPTTVKKIISARRFSALGLEDLARMRVSLTKVRPFIIARGWSPGALVDLDNLRARFSPAPDQLSLFAA
ncbi:putative DNA modification/repair radical SAM protein [Parvularcula sp. LCG005]|uniref:putative DNA modification/repair radical SAM protein n=1 Tax=Parvularcula sp. LCG005 TaxID=3078805 RepID=UPI0029437174|nr:putative DNA modification/repair radical SAM protein [Parvularcula sp. LCG005]WOI54687.1 putative DNA modification/repair radical SAM protein [Parvularcula sp. LCG005]